MQRETCVALVGLMLATGPAAFAADPGSAERYEFTQVHMGVPFKLTLYAPDEASANRAAAAAFGRIEQLNAVFSDYDPGSEAMRLSRQAGTGSAVKVSPELLFVLSRSLALSEATDGVFDVTVGPLVKQWRRARRQRRLPKDEALQKAKSRVGRHLVRLDKEAGTVELREEGMRLDFGGIAKGYAADEALRVLRCAGINSALIDAGGDIVAGDPPPCEAGWRIGLAPIDRPDAPPERFLRIANTSVATSGDAYQFVEIDGVRYSHILDPRTGMGLTTSSSVTIIAPDGITADCLASAVSVLGPEQGIALLEQTESAAGLIVLVEGGAVRSVETKAFGTFVEQD